MNLPRAAFWSIVLAAAMNWPLTGAVLQRSDVIFMYQADRQTYADYGATVLAWGGKPTPKSLEAAAGVKFFGSVGMVTEFARYYERFPQTYEQGLCRDVTGQPVKVPWLTDHQHQGIPFWWCCTQQPQFRQYLSARVVETVKAGAYGVHIDDHLGTSGGLWLGVCFCDRCVQGFRPYLQSLDPGERQRLDIGDANAFDYREVVKQWLAAATGQKRNVTAHPLWSHWTIYQTRAAAAFMRELKALAAQTAGRPAPMGANAGLLWPRHLADYQALDLFSAETDHHAEQRRFSDLPLVAYRMAEAVGRPYASTASGGDWAFIKEHNLPGLVRGWIALSYAAGHSLMAPHRQWCHTPQKGTHWYDGPKEKFAPLYQFVRRNSALIDAFETYADLTVVMPYRSFVKNPGRWFERYNQLAASNLTYRVLLGGDEMVDVSIAAQDLGASPALLVLEREDLLPADRKVLDQPAPGGHVFSNLNEAMRRIQPAVQLQAAGTVRVLPRCKANTAVIHLLNYQYDPAKDDVRPVSDVRVTIDEKRLGLADVKTCRFLSPDRDPVTLPVEAGKVKIPSLDLWGLLSLETRR